MYSERLEVGDKVSCPGCNAEYIVGPSSRGENGRIECGACGAVIEDNPTEEREDEEEDGTDSTEYQTDAR